MLPDNKLSAIIKYKLPEFVRDEHEMFVAFVQSYVEFLEQEGNYLHYMERFQRNLDVDRADDDFLDKYLKEFATTFPRKTKLPTNQLLKLMREFYLAKGSEDSFRFIFTILFDADIDIIYPRELMYIPSSGDYSADILAYITGENWFKLRIDNNDLNAFIEGQSSGASAVIDSITSTYVNGAQVNRLEISSYDGKFTPGETVTLTVDDTAVTETIYGSLASIKVVDGGTNYKIDDTLTIIDSTSGTRAKAHISQLEKGPLNQVTIVNAGTGYEVGDTVKAVSVLGSDGYGFRAKVYEVGLNGEIVRVRVEDGGYEYRKKTLGNIRSVNGSGAILELNGDDVGKIKSIEVIDGGVNYSDPNTITIQIDTDDGVDAVLEPQLDGMFITPKRYRNEKSTPSGNSKLMDSYYYQQFSYVIASNESPHNWLGIVKRIAHPAGTQLFGMYQLRSSVDVLVSIAEGGQTAISRNLRFLFEIDLQQPFSTVSQRTLLRYSENNCQLGLVLGDLDDMKFLDSFNWVIGDFAEVTVGDVIGNCTPKLEKQDSANITIT